MQQVESFTLSYVAAGGFVHSRQEILFRLLKTDTERPELFMLRVVNRFGQLAKPYYICL
jgi:hypothetical protein